MFAIVQDLKEIARELGAPAGGRKDELIAAILAQAGVGGAEELDDGLGDAGEDLLGGTGAAGAAAGTPAAPAAADGKHAAIVFSLQKQEVGMRPLGARVRTWLLLSACHCQLHFPRAVLTPCADCCCAGGRAQEGQHRGHQDPQRWGARTAQSSKVSDIVRAVCSVLCVEGHAQRSAQQAEPVACRRARLA